MTFKEFLKSKLFIIGGSIFLIFLLAIQFKQYQSRKDVQKEISELTKQADELQKSNQDLGSFIEYLKSPEYKEKAAREQLKLKKEGEVVYSFTATNPAMTSEEQAEQERQKSSNIKKWWNYFFNPNS